MGQAKHFQRKYLKTKKISGSLGDLTVISNKEKVKSRLSLNLPPTTSSPMILCRAVAMKDCVPSPYDCEGLAYKAGDLIDVTERNISGIWRGCCNGREGNFKFIDVKTEEMLGRATQMKKSESKENFPQGRSISDLLSSIRLENLTPVFVLNGYDSTEDIRDMSESDLEYLGIVDEHIKDLLLTTIRCLPESKLSVKNLKEHVAIHDHNKSPGRDSGFHSPQETST